MGENIIRAATLDDLIEIQRLDTLPQESERYSPLDALDPRYIEERFDYLPYILGEDGKWCFVCPEDNKILKGVTLFAIIDWSEDRIVKKVGWLERTVVDPAYRKNGIGSSLRQFALDFFRNQGIRYVLGETHSGNEISIKSLKKLGGVPVYTTFMFDLGEGKKEPQ